MRCFWVYCKGGQKIAYEITIVFVGSISVITWNWSRKSDLSYCQIMENNERYVVAFFSPQKATNRPLKRLRQRKYCSECSFFRIDTWPNMFFFQSKCILLLLQSICLTSENLFLTKTSTTQKRNENSMRKFLIRENGQRNIRIRFVRYVIQMRIHLFSMDIFNWTISFHESVSAWTHKFR